MGSETGRNRKPARKKVAGMPNSSDAIYTSGEASPVCNKAQDHKVVKKPVKPAAEFGADFDNNRKADKYYANKTPGRERKLKPRQVQTSRPAGESREEAGGLVQFKEIQCTSRETLQDLVGRIVRYADRGYRVVVMTDGSFEQAVNDTIKQAVDSRSLSASHVRRVVVEVRKEQGIPPVRAVNPKQAFAEIDREDEQESRASQSGLANEIDLDAILEQTGGEKRMSATEFEAQFPALTPDDEEETEDDEF